MTRTIITMMRSCIATITIITTNAIVINECSLGGLGTHNNNHNDNNNTNMTIMIRRRIIVAVIIIAARRPPLRAPPRRVFCRVAFAAPALAPAP